MNQAIAAPNEAHDNLSGIDVELKTPFNGVPASFIHSQTSALQGFLSASDGDSDKLDQIAEYFRGDNKEFSDIDLLQAVRHLEVKLGTPQIGQKRLDVLYNYVKLQSQIESFEKDRDRLLR